MLPLAEASVFSLSVLVVLAAGGGMGAGGAGGRGVVLILRRPQEGKAVEQELEHKEGKEVEQELEHKGEQEVEWELVHGITWAQGSVNEEEKEKAPGLKVLNEFLSC
ncbi:hypothetical protein HYDPIDRAFT_170619 [Hydnomerulius pinastri MD-312]|uniref:Uncharacterized protein n=1 Tax=Hydnomerulius pinastri MD-312 TaxID=994086 RepID=A0A0C9W1H9_9AGAM|nr:hypothetical protein HYDPIDRAFT_170619 [Hydnomerulius pinastri MD-312]